MKVRIGLVAHSSGWEQLCAQEGVPVTTINLATQAVDEECSLLVANRALSPKEREVVEEYLQNGGAVIGYTRHLHTVAGIEGAVQDLSYIVSDNAASFPSVHLLDLGVEGMIPRGANVLRTEMNTYAVLAGPVGGGFAVVLPFDLETLLQDARPATKSFHFKLDRLPSERVSLVGKAELRQLVRDAFKYLHHVRGLPYVHLWYFPRDLKNVFAFRIDADGASREEIDTLYEIGREHDVSMSWFLDTKRHGQWLDHFAYFVGQEMGLHCYEHQTYPQFDANLKNLMHGLQLMHRAGLRSAGFSAPYGDWNPGLAKAIDQVGFEFSSEFSYAYDSLPLFPEAEGVMFKSLQVPVHPVCIGSMAMVGYTEARMFEYFNNVFRQKLSRHEPLFFYHHPSHRCWDVVRRLFSVCEAGVENMTMGDYARWWRNRMGIKLALNVDNDVIRAGYDLSCVPNDVWIRVVKPDGSERILPISQSINLRTVAEWITPEKPVPPPDDIRRTREFDPRQLVGELYNTLIRKFK